MNEVFPSAKHKATCNQCRVAGMCPLHYPELIALKDLDGAVARSRLLHRGQLLFDAGDCFLSLYVVQSGSIKVCVPMEGGDEQVLGFFLPGDLVGLDGVGNQYHSCTALALEHSSVCELPFENLDTLSHSLPTLLHHLYRLIGQEISNNQAMLILLGRKNAEQRFAAFLLSHSLRCGRLGLSPHEFNLSMSRANIANFLGLTSETISRLFARFHKDGVVRVKGRLVRIMDVDRLRVLLGDATINSARP